MHTHISDKYNITKEDVANAIKLYALVISSAKKGAKLNYQLNKIESDESIPKIDFSVMFDLYNTIEVVMKTQINANSDFYFRSIRNNILALTFLTNPIRLKPLLYVTVQEFLKSYDKPIGIEKFIITTVQIVDKVGGKLGLPLIVFHSKLAEVIKMWIDKRINKKGFLFSSAINGDQMSSSGFAKALYMTCQRLLNVPKVTNY